MNSSDISSIRKHYASAEKSFIRDFYGVYVRVDDDGATTPMPMHSARVNLDEITTNGILSVLKKTMTGKPEKNLVDIRFETAQVMDSDEHRLLMKLRESKCGDEAARNELVKRIIASANMATSYVILMAGETIDVKTRSEDSDPEMDSENMFTYIVCAICPVKLTKTDLTLDFRTQEFDSVGANTVIGAPTAGFVFPVLEDGATNIYNAQFYTKNTDDSHDELVKSLFNIDAPPAADAQRASFQSVLVSALGDDCNLSVVKAVYGNISNMIDENNADMTEEPVMVDMQTISNALEEAGIDEEKIERFEEGYIDAFGADAQLPPTNLIDEKKFGVETSEDVVISLPGSKNRLVETRVIDGIKYIMIRVEDGVEVNGMSIRVD